MSEYNPNKHHRRSIRLKGYDYSLEGLYFITICCHRMMCRFGRIDEMAMYLNAFGQIADAQWQALPGRFPNVVLHEYVVMPNHMHGIIELQPVGAGLAPAQWAWAGASPAPTGATIGDIVGAYKSLVANGCLTICNSQNRILGKLWQRNYYEHIIRSEQAYQTISQYIYSNPANWKADKLYEE